MRSEIVIDEENSAGMRTAGRILVWFGTVLPAWLVRRTPIMVWILKFLAFLGGSSDRLKRARRNAAFARRNNLPRSQYDAPGISYLHRAGHRVPLILPTYAQRHRYEQERLTVQYRTKVFNQVSWFFRGGPLPETRLPEADLQEWFRALLLNTGAHWYLERVTDGDGEAALRMDFSTVVDSVIGESRNCKYNIRSFTLSDSGRLEINPRSTKQSVPKLIAHPDDDDPRPYRHAVYLASVLLQQAMPAAYHNWVHFYLNDLIAYNVQVHCPEGHWLRVLLDPHMRYQHCLNLNGMFTPNPTHQENTETWDDVMYGGRLSSWTQDTFQRDIADKVLGYYKGADHAPACRETNRIEFTLATVVPEEPNGRLQEYLLEWEDLTRTFVREVIERSSVPKDEALMALILENIEPFIRPSAFDRLPDDAQNTQGRFTYLLTRYVLQAGLLHGFEHFSLYSWFAPLGLPQRIREFWDLDLELSDYAYEVDFANAHFGHQMFCNYTPNADDQWNWATLRYGFSDPDLEAAAEAFVAKIQDSVNRYDAEVLAPVRAVLERNGIEVPEDTKLSPRRLGSSIAM